MLGGDTLVTEYQQGVIEMGAMDTSEVVIAKRLGQIQTDDLGAHGRIEGANFE